MQQKSMAGFESLTKQIHGAQLRPLVYCDKLSRSYSFNHDDNHEVSLFATFWIFIIILPFVFVFFFKISLAVRLSACFLTSFPRSQQMIVRTTKITPKLS